MVQICDIAHAIRCHCAAVWLHELCRLLEARVSVVETLAREPPLSDRGVYA